MRPDVRVTKFAKSEKGTVAVIWAMALVVFFGFLAMLFDIGRVGASQTEMQAFADHVALAAAGELNGGDDAISRAVLAANTMINDTQTFGTGGDGRNLGGSNDFTLRFLTGLPADDRTAIPASMVINPADWSNPARNRVARYVEVTTVQRTVGMEFFRVLRGLLGEGTGAVNAQIRASAIAGSESVICDITPMFFCAPTNRDLLRDAEIGTMIKLRTGQGNSPSAWGAGNFGFLDVEQAVDEDALCAEFAKNGGAKNNPGPLARCLMGAEITKTTCVPFAGLNLRTGQQVGISNDAFNVRFDMFTKNDPNRDDLRFVPAPNIVHGLKADATDGCFQGSYSNSDEFVRIPPESCLVPGNCGGATDGNGRFSAAGGTWTDGTTSARDTYLAANHSELGATPSEIATQFDNLYSVNNGYFSYLRNGDGLPDNFDLSSGKYDDTRFMTYLQEIKKSRTAGIGYVHSDPALPKETGTVQCHTLGASEDPFRRVITAAVVDCTANAVNGNKDGVPAMGFVRVFLTEPVGIGAGAGANNFDIYGEILGDASTGGGGAQDAGGIARVVIRLKR